MISGFEFVDDFWTYKGTWEESPWAMTWSQNQSHMEQSNRWPVSCFSSITSLKRYCSIIWLLAIIYQNITRFHMGLAKNSIFQKELSFLGVGIYFVRSKMLERNCRLTQNPIRWICIAASLYALGTWLMLDLAIKSCPFWQLNRRMLTCPRNLNCLQLGWVLPITSVRTWGWGIRRKAE